MAILASGPGDENSNKAYEYIEKIVHAERPERAVQASFHGDRCFGAGTPVIPQRLDAFHAGRNAYQGFQWRHVEEAEDHTHG